MNGQLINFLTHIGHLLRFGRWNFQMNGQERVTCPAIVIAKLNKNKWRRKVNCRKEQTVFCRWREGGQSSSSTVGPSSTLNKRRSSSFFFSFAYFRCCHCECEIEFFFFASEVELHVGNRQFSDAACVFVGVHVFIFVPKRFRRLQQLELPVCRIFITCIGSFQFFLEVWWDWVSWWVATPSVHHDFKHNDLSLEILSFILVERGLMMMIRNLTQKTRSEKQGDMFKCWTLIWQCTACSFCGLLGGWSGLCLLKLSTMLYLVSRPLFGFWGREFLHVRGLSSRLSASCCYYFESENERIRGETDIISYSVKLQDRVFFFSSSCCNCYERTERRVL